MVVNAADFRTNMSDYFQRLAEEDIFIKRHGKIIGILTDPQREEKKRAAETGEARLTRSYLERIIELLEEIKAAVR